MDRLIKMAAALYLLLLLLLLLRTHKIIILPTD